MSFIDWLVLLFTMTLVVLYGVYKGRTTKDIDGYYRSSRQLPWYMVMLSVIGTQASAVTFLSGPGQAYADGMRFGISLIVFRPEAKDRYLVPDSGKLRFRNRCLQFRSGGASRLLHSAFRLFQLKNKKSILNMPP